MYPLCVWVPRSLCIPPFQALISLRCCVLLFYYSILSVFKSCIFHRRPHKILAIWFCTCVALFSQYVAYFFCPLWWWCLELLFVLLSLLSVVGAVMDMVSCGASGRRPFNKYAPAAVTTDDDDYVLVLYSFFQMLNGCKAFFIATIFAMTSIKTLPNTQNRLVTNKISIKHVSTLNIIYKVSAEPTIR